MHKYMSKYTSTTFMNTIVLQNTEITLFLLNIIRYYWVLPITKLNVRYTYNSCTLYLDRVILLFFNFVFKGL